MRYFFITILFSLLLSACSRHNAFYHFEMSKNKELSEDAMMSSKIYKDQIVEGLVTAIYLNRVFPKKYNEDDFFYLYLYSKNKEAISFTCNSQKPLKIIKLPSKNIFSNLLSFDAQWADYYLVKCKHTPAQELHLKIQNNEFSSDDLLFFKNE